ncbi:MAG: acetoin utilization protein AcuC [Spirochaetes bacterium]|nr:acetoin utilization protein AcuC [Spirochaetota bacterium]
MCQIVYHPDYKKYNLGYTHPFNPIRVEMTLDLLNELGYSVKPLTPVSITPELLYGIHDPSYIEVVEKVSSGEILKEAENYGLGNPDNPIVKGMAEGARNQAGGTLFAAGLLLENKAKKVLQLGGGFHHAHRNSAAGFCLYNDIALAIKEMTKAGWHVVYLDLDVHHGDGVQEIFYSDDKVMTISLHESGEYLFPGTGWMHELGCGPGRSLKVNLPLEPFTEGDSYLDVLNGVAAPALAWFKPDAMVVQAGADAHFSDPLADLMLTTQDFERIYRRVLELAEQFCNGRALFTLGGGYSLTAVPRIWVILYLILSGYKVPDKIPQDFRKRWNERISQDIPEYFHDPEQAFKPVPRKEKIVKLNHEMIQRMMDTVAVYWF